MGAMSIGIKWTNEAEFLEFTFPAYLGQAMAEEAISQWDARFAELHEPVSLVWDCSELIDYDPLARRAWQEALRRHQPKVNDIWLVSASWSVRLGVRLISLLKGMPVKTVSTRQAIRVPVAALAY